MDASVQGELAGPPQQAFASFGVLLDSAPAQKGYSLQVEGLRSRCRACRGHHHLDLGAQLPTFWAAVISETLSKKPYRTHVSVSYYVGTWALRATSEMKI